MMLKTASAAAARLIAASGLLAIGLAGCQTPKPPAMSAKGPLIQSAFACADVTETIYFEAGQSVITRPAERLISLAAAQSRGCTVTGVAVVGLADAPGDSGSNLALSKRRADAVKAALHHYGDPAWQAPLFNQGIPAELIRRSIAERGGAAWLGAG